MRLPLLVSFLFAPILSAATIVPLDQHFMAIPFSTNATLRDNFGTGMRPDGTMETMIFDFPSSAAVYFTVSGARSLYEMGDQVFGVTEAAAFLQPNSSYVLHAYALLSSPSGPWPTSVPITLNDGPFGYTFGAPVIDTPAITNPEPGTCLLMLCGVGLLMLRRTASPIRSHSERPRQ